ncbi:hypothetical protein ACEWAO_23025 [Vibrio parahaemolyticus]|uniref:hypothetical protein n=1 Tax=Vibrio parahaemolyticus TaxID=670 RepID=UPI00193E5B36|nr:hypothetical protein [Vibrio parahaemolyticus]MBM5000914.1 hypothetical protein [Vibrio parahaemolyticus]MCR9697554.1 hypothetical protein [Vibrio parahaemolyticus]MCR9763906.1 hypothetical protein [Vibrio parahaemolyticus]MDF4937020.1 hypothetical protein [Vibrio parahaemolyticus]MDF5285737.1 hypothetical protein [Vibrio parahaemolyticus]
MKDWLVKTGRKIHSDWKSMDWRWVIFWGVLLGWGASTLYISYLSYLDAQAYGLHILCLIVIGLGVLFDTTDVQDRLPFTTVGPLPIAIPIAISLIVLFTVGREAASIFIMHPVIYAFLSFLTVVLKSTKA